MRGKVVSSTGTVLKGYGRELPLGAVIDRVVHQEGQEEEFDRMDLGSEKISLSDIQLKISNKGRLACRIQRSAKERKICWDHRRIRLRDALVMFDNFDSLSEGEGMC